MATRLRGSAEDSRIAQAIASMRALLPSIQTGGAFSLLRVAYPYLWTLARDGPGPANRTKCWAHNLL